MAGGFDRIAACKPATGCGFPGATRRTGCTAVAPAAALAEQLRNAVLYEDREILVLDKPAGLAVHKGSGLDYGVIELLRAMRPDEPFLELAHRLDRDTSGCLTLARTAAALRLIQEAFQGRASRKTLSGPGFRLLESWPAGSQSAIAPQRAAERRTNGRSSGGRQAGPDPL